jgi:hypothetical protein
MARVAYASAAKGQNWVMGCVFIPMLSEVALQEWTHDRRFKAVGGN